MTREALLEEALRECVQDLDAEGKPCWCHIPSMIPYRGHDAGCTAARAALRTADDLNEEADRLAAPLFATTSAHGQGHETREVQTWQANDPHPVNFDALIARLAFQRERDAEHDQRMLREKLIAESKDVACLLAEGDKRRVAEAEVRALREAVRALVFAWDAWQQGLNTVKDVDRAIKAARALLEAPEPCPECKGTSYDWRPCPTCGGTGRAGEGKP